MNTSINDLWVGILLGKTACDISGRRELENHYQLLILGNEGNTAHINTYNGYSKVCLDEIINGFTDELKKRSISEYEIMNEGYYMLIRGVQPKIIEAPAMSDEDVKKFTKLLKKKFGR